MKIKDAVAACRRAREADLKNTAPIVPAAFSRKKTQVGVPESFSKVVLPANDKPLPDAAADGGAVPALPSLQEALEAVPEELRDFFKQKFFVDFSIVESAAGSFCARAEDAEKSKESSDEETEDLPEID